MQPCVQFCHPACDCDLYEIRSKCLIGTYVIWNISTTPNHHYCSTQLTCTYPESRQHPCLHAGVQYARQPTISRLKGLSDVGYMYIVFPRQNFQNSSTPYSLAFVCALFSIGSIFVAFITSPLTFSLPAMKSLCAFALPLTSLPKSSSDNESVTIDRLYLASLLCCQIPGVCAESKGAAANSGAVES